RQAGARFPGRLQGERTRPLGGACAISAETPCTGQETTVPHEGGLPDRELLRASPVRLLAAVLADGSPVRDPAEALHTAEVASIGRTAHCRALIVTSRRECYYPVDEREGPVMQNGRRFLVAVLANPSTGSAGTAGPLSRHRLATRDDRLRRQIRRG